jgi:hypothetical protein
MTERKPPGMSFPSWVDQRIAEAEERGVFDNLPGTGKPIPKGEADHGQAWLRDYLRREGVSAEELLPVPFRLRREIERLAGEVTGLRSEQQVREVASELNRRIMDWRRISAGPPIFVPLVNEEDMVGRWQAAHRAPAPPPAGARPETAGPPRPPRPRRWWRRRPRRRSP